MKLIKYIFITTFLLTNIYANKLIIDAEKFELNEKTGSTVFTGNVKMQRGDDRIDAGLIEIYTSEMDDKGVREMKKFIATGNVYFTVYTKEKIYQGKGDKLVYNPKEMKYTIIGNGLVEEKIEGTKLYGETIYLDEQSGEAKIKGTKKKPVRFIMKIKE